MRIRHYLPAYNSQCSVGLYGQGLRDAVWVTRSGHDLDHKNQASCDLISMRNAALHRAIEDGCDYLYMQDSDVYSPNPKGAIMPLLSTCIETGAAMVGAAVMMRTRPPRLNAWPIQGGIYEVEKIGTGMVLIDLAKIREWYGDYDGPCFNRSYAKPDGKNRMIDPQVGSDIWFCKVIRAHGQTIYCNALLPTIHVDATFFLGYDGKGTVFDSFTDSAGPSEESDAALDPQVATGAP